MYWRRNGVTLERAHTAIGGVLRSEVRVHNVTRDELDAHYECVAQNADVTEPLTTSVVVKMYRKLMNVLVFIFFARCFVQVGYMIIIVCPMSLSDVV